MIYDIFKYKNPHGEISNIFRTRYICIYNLEDSKNKIDKFQC